ncbi:nuclear transport factor 2 family protein [Streptomyces sp. NPDC047000]|uniref:nuclear transport factor 2 family protein n=1 Tax=Streptomyces sp. NPDC047000 TaxID=3155474 RepID=UPI0033EF2E8D
MDREAAAGGPDEVQQAIAGELRLMDPRVRASRELAGRLLDPEFTEVGASGRRWTRDAMLAELAAHPGSSADGPRYEPSGITGARLAPGLVHLTFETVLGGRRTRHSSIWRKRDGDAGWRMYHHQATVVPPGVE